MWPSLFFPFYRKICIVQRFSSYWDSKVEGVYKFPFFAKTNQNSPSLKKKVYMKLLETAEDLILEKILKDF